MTAITPVIAKSDTVHVFKNRTWDTDTFAVSGIYAIGFPNGVVKFGRSKNLRKRLKSYDLTGHANAANFYLLRKHPVPNSAEMTVLSRAGDVFIRDGAPECFYCSELEAIGIMSGHLGETTPAVKPDFDDINVVVITDDGRKMPYELYQAYQHDIPVVHLVLAFERHMINEDLADAVFGIMGERQLIAFKAIATKNAVLLGRGMAYEDRKKILEAFALENRAVKLIKEPVP